MFGTNSMGGIVNIITKTPGTKSWLNLETVVRRNNSQDYMVSSSHSFNDFKYKLAAAWQRTDGFALSKSFEPTDFETGGIRDNSSGDKLNLNGNLNWLPDGVNQLGFSFNLSSMKDKDIPSSIYERKRRRYDNWLRYNAGLSAEWMLGETTQFTALLARDTAQDRYLEFGSQDILSLDSEMKTDCYSLAGKLKLRLNQDRSCNFGYRGELLFSKRKDETFIKYGPTTALKCIPPLSNMLTPV
jgi:outer membrane receptor for ferrienterochelin and colicin